MELQKLQQQVLELPISDRWQLVQSVLASIQQETLSLSVSDPTINPLTENILNDANSPSSPNPFSPRRRGARSKSLLPLGEGFRVRVSNTPLTDLAPWTQSLMGVIQLETENPTETYVDFLEEKYS